MLCSRSPLSGGCNYPGDAAWDVPGTVFACGEVKLTPGGTYAAGFTTLETPESIGNFVNFKKQVDHRKPGFNPYLRPAVDPYPEGETLKLGKEKATGDPDIQVVEYAKLPVQSAASHGTRFFAPSAG